MVRPAKSFPQILFPAKYQNVKISQNSASLQLCASDTYKGTGCLANIPPKHPPSNRIMKHWIWSTVWTCPPGRGNFHPAKLIPEIVRIFNLPETTILIGRKPQKPHLTSSIKHPSISTCIFWRVSIIFGEGGFSDTLYLYCCLWSMQAKQLLLLSVAGMFKPWSRAQAARVCTDFEAWGSSAPSCILIGNECLEPKVFNWHHPKFSSSSSLYGYML